MSAIAESEWGLRKTVQTTGGKTQKDGEQGKEMCQLTDLKATYFTILG